MPYVVSIPVWSPTYLEVFANATWPALVAAVSDFEQPYKFVIHTDNPSFIENLTRGNQVEIRPIVGDGTYVTLQNSHSDAIQQAGVGDRIILLNADIVVSKNLLHAVHAHFERGMQAVVTMGIRTTKENGLPPSGYSPADLLSWAWDHKHPIIQDLIWGKGGSIIPTNLFWEGPDTVVAHGFHLHPVGIIKPGELNFISTIDGDLLDHFPRGAIHIVNDPNDLAICESSTEGKRFPWNPHPMTPEEVAGAMSFRASEYHRWQFTHRIIIKGNGQGLSDEADVRRILQLMGTNTHFHKPL